MPRTSLALLPNLVEGTLPTQVLPEFCPAGPAIHFCFVSISLASFLLKPSRVGTKDAGYHQWNMRIDNLNFKWEQGVTYIRIGIPHKHMKRPGNGFFIMRVHVQSYAHHFAKRIIRECKEHVVAFPLTFHFWDMCVQMPMCMHMDMQSIQNNHLVNVLKCYNLYILCLIASSEKAADYWKQNGEEAFIVKVPIVRSQRK